MKKTNPIARSKQTGEPSIGVWLTLGNTFVAELMGKLGFDWVVIDRQHGSIEWSEVGRCIQAIDATGSSSLVRVEWNSPELIMRALDLGAAGVIVPMVSTADDARRACQAAHYPPQGMRSFGPTRSYYLPDGERPTPVCILMIETRAALENLPQIASVPGVDGLFAGPADLALDLGVPISLPMHQAVTDGIESMVKHCAQHGILAGAASFSLDNAKDFVGRGLKVVTVSADVSYIQSGARQDIAYCKSLRKGSSS